jgi:ferredoxin
MKIKVDTEKCIGCGTCVSLCNECFEIKDGKSHPKSEDCKCESCDLKEVASSCPVEAITIEE